MIIALKKVLSGLQAHLAFLVMGLAWQMAAFAATVEDVRIWSGQEHTRLVFDLSAEVTFNVFTLDSPDRLVVDITNTRMNASLAALDFSASPVNSIRTSPRDGTDLRVVLDLKNSIEHNSFTLDSTGSSLDRLVLDLFDGGSVPSATTTARTIPPPTQADQRDIRVAIVAGHGGQDPGAPSYNRGFWEKDVTLDIARAVERRLEQTSGYEPVMIRDGDYSVELKTRPIMAREQRVDIYISIHADSYRGRSVQGVTIYALSGETADRENIRRIEQKENQVDLLGGVAGDTRISDVDDDLALTLLDLSMAWSMEQSVTLGTHILGTLDGVARLRKDKVQGGNLWELRSPDIPSILIETGYLSNPEEAEKLASSRYQGALAGAIVQGIQNYFYERPPEGTLIAWQKENGVVPDTYTVSRGDSLSEIAQRFGVTLNDLKAANGLQSNVIRIGQSLTIPGFGGSGQISEHRIARGETLSEIAQRYRVSLSSLRRMNNLAGDKILIGQVLKIPTSI